jgi:uncharacterized protein
VRAVLDPNVIISGLLSATGTPANLLRAFDQGEFEVLVSPKLLDELSRALAYPKLRRYISEEEANAVVRWIGEAATTAPDLKHAPRVHSTDSDDDYLITLAENQRAVLVSGDKHLLPLADQIPVLAPRKFLEMLREN